MPLDAQAIYIQMGRLIEQMPVIPDEAPPQNVQIWLGRLHALLVQMNSIADIVNLNNASRNLSNYSVRSHAINDIKMIAYRALATAELSAPVADQGSFIAAGNTFDAMAAVGKVLSSAISDVLIVDPYMDDKALTDFALLTREEVIIRLLADMRHHKPALKPAVQRWVSQYAATRPLEARLAPERSLHDRLIIVDDTTVWVLTQSLNAFAARAPASIVRSDGDAAVLKVEAYRDMWASASAL